MEQFFIDILPFAAWCVIVFVASQLLGRAYVWFAKRAVRKAGLEPPPD